jgi:DNA-directed RNA polymerase specialized sigma24 family protein
MDKERMPTPEDFDCLLAWLNPDREQAGRRYEEIQRRLIKIFASRGCPEAEAEFLTDVTINRVTLKACEVAPGYIGDPARYFYVVANNVRLEDYRRRKPTSKLPPPVMEAEDIEQAERADECLERCMQRFTAADRALVLLYHQWQGRAKIEYRQELARQHGLSLNALRIKIHRLLTILRRCVLDCLAQAPG